MENHGRAMNSSEQPQEFEFGSLTPSSPSQDSENSPADHLFFNGRLLPHVFQAPNNNTKWPLSRTTSEYISRSTSTNSRSSFGSSSSSNSSSTSYSPRTSCFNGNNNNNTTINHMPLDVKPPSSIYRETVDTTRMKGVEMVKASLYRSYSSQRWQYITPAPVKRSGGIRVGGRKKKAVRIRKKAGERRGSRVMKWWRRILMAAIFACRECHALEGPEKDL
ncbi:unnamed protein product [Eruca vesicaria subsp. sativa]|uniref:Uncharacterized protein n=1 Tax=Eruca vesicaria subsp. sativa TaxID=29727 RepID=A0ABC8IQY4_ERUVS|nr:unnamed protein product [Eruca vesicaria subsp. sativa]